MSQLIKNVNESQESRISRMKTKREASTNIKGKSTSTVNTVAFMAESSIYFIFSPGSLCSSDVYRCESGRCCTLPFFLTFFIISSFQVFLLY